MRNAPTVGEALRKISVYHHPNSQGGVVVARTDGPMAEYGYAIYHRSVLGVRQIFDSVLATRSPSCANCAGRPGVPTEVAGALCRRPTRARSASCSAARCASMPTRRAALSSHWPRKRPVQGSDPQVLRQLEAQAIALAPGDWWTGCAARCGCCC